MSLTFWPHVTEFLEAVEILAFCSVISLESGERSIPSTDIVLAFDQLVYGHRRRPPAFFFMRIFTLTGDTVRVCGMRFTSRGS